MKGRKLLALAKYIYRSKNSEEWFRLGIHAVYYGTIWELWDLLERKGYKIRGKERPHRKVKVLLDKEGYFRAKRLLEKLTDIRIVSDYNPNAHITKKDLKKAIKLSKLILREVGL